MDKSQKGYLILLMFISPLLGLITFLKSKNEKVLLFFGVLFFGVAGSVIVYREGSDAHSHLMNARRYYLDKSLIEFLTDSYNLLTFQSVQGSTDLYLHIISFFSASILQSPALIHVFSGLTLGYFFTKSVLLLLHNNLRNKKGYILISFIFLFILIRSIGALASIRMWTGMWVFFYGVYGYVKTKNKKYFLVIVFSNIVHFSYLIIIIPVIIAFIFQKMKKLIVIMYCVSFFTSIGFSFFEAYIPKTDLTETKQKSYAITSEDDQERFEQDKINYQKAAANMNFYKANGEGSYLNYSIVFLTLILFYFYLKKALDTNLNSLISIGAVLYTFSNLVTFSPSLQGRTKTIAATFILAAAIYLQLNLKKYLLSKISMRYLNYGFIIFLISSIPMVMFQLSDFLQTFSFFIVLFPQFSWILGDSDNSLRNTIGILID